MDQIRSRAEIARDAENAAERFVASGIPQPNPFIGEPGEADWQVAYARFCAFHADPLAEDGPA